MNVIEITAEKKPAQDTIRLAAYCRVSSDSEDQLHSFAAQIRYYKDYERRHPQYRLVDIYADEGITGTCMDKRDDLHRLIRDCKKGLIDRIIVKSVSRFARNTQELLATIRFLKDIGVSVYFEEQGIDTDKLNSEMIVTFPGMAAQQESESISGNMRWSYKKRMESGDFNCCAPAYGFDLIDGNLVINETEAVVVRRIFSMYLQGYGKQAIANKLNEESVPRRHGTKLWYAFGIDYMLNNERYMGDALLQKKYTTDTLPFKKVKNRGERPKYYVENANPAIVSRETYTDKINGESGWTMVGIYADKGITGTSVKKRDDFNRLMRHCKQGKVDMIITKSVARFARNTLDCLKHTRMLKEHNVDVYFEEQGIHSIQPGAEFYITIYGSIAQSESENISANVRWGKSQSAKEGNVPFHYKRFLGYRRGSDGKPEIDPEQAAVVKRIYERFLAGDSLATIANDLNADGIPTPSGIGQWQRGTIESILTNEKYKYIAAEISKELRRLFFISRR